MFHSVHKHVVVLMVTKEIREGAYYKKKVNLPVLLLVIHLLYEFQKAFKVL